MATMSRTAPGGVAIKLPVRRGVITVLLTLVLPLALAAALPFVSNDYWVLIATRAAIYWVLVSGLNLVVGFAGQLAIGYVALLALGAYTTSVLAAGNVSEPVPAFEALLAAGVVGGVFGVVVGLPALRLRTFYFAMATLGFATIVTQIALAWQSVTGGGIGISGPAFPAPFDEPHGFYFLCLGIAAFPHLGIQANQLDDMGSEGAFEEFADHAGGATYITRCGMSSVKILFAQKSLPTLQS